MMKLEHSDLSCNKTIISYNIRVLYTVNQSKKNSGVNYFRGVFLYLHILHKNENNKLSSIPKIHGLTSMSNVSHHVS